MKVCTIIGARPQFIKAAALSHAIRKDGRIDEVIINTGQHFDTNMADIFFQEMGLPAPDYDLGISRGTHGQNTGRMLGAIEEVLLKEQPDWVLVYGDANSTLAGALAATKIHIKVAHVEAGLRSFNRKMPEEVNRILTDHCADLLFAPTQTAVDNLIREGIGKDKISLIGDIMYDCVLLFREKIRRNTQILENLGLKAKNYILATVHRQENTNDINRLKSIFKGFSDSGRAIVLPLHPRTANIIRETGMAFTSNIKIIEPVGYMDMAVLQANAKAIATDSGGVQKEAFFHQVPCITLRDETEWIELVDMGVNQLVGADAGKIVKALQKDYDYISWEGLDNPYGDGKTGQLIIDELIRQYG